MPRQGLPPNMIPNQQQQFQMSAQDTELVRDLTIRLMAQATEEEKIKVKASLQSRMDPQKFQQYQAQGTDPLFLFYWNQAMTRHRQKSKRPQGGS
jgi:hypothetical protein